MPDRESSKARAARSPSTPADYPTTPNPLSALDHSFLLQAIMEVQRSIGQLTQSTTTLTDDAKEHRKQLNRISHIRISHITYSVGVMGTILLAALVFLANKIADAIVAGYKLHP